MKQIHDTIYFTLVNLNRYIYTYTYVDGYELKYEDILHNVFY